MWGSLISKIAGKAFTVGSLLRSPWFIGIALGGLVTLAVTSWTLGYKFATNSCEAQKRASENRALNQASQANREIGDARVDGERKRSAIREEFHDVHKNFEDLETLQADLVANGCELDPELLRELNRVILRTGGTD